MKIASLLLVSFVARFALAATPAVDPNLYLSDVKFLASPELKGRATGSPELEKAAAFIAGKFREFGLKGPAGKDYFQPFQATTATRLGKANRLQFKENNRTTTLQYPGDFIPFNFSEAGKWSGPVVFAGYGITAPQQSYDDYAGIDVKGKIVLVLQHEPQEFEERSVFGGKNFTIHAEFFSKASNAKQHGAIAVIMIADRMNHPDKTEELQRFGTADGPKDAGIPFVQVKAAQVAGWFAAAGKNVDTLAGEIDKDLKPRSFAFPDSIRVNGETDLARDIKTVRNIAAYLPGETGEYIIIGAHYDHLGLGDQHSLAPSMAGSVHPGADDNASGTAGVIELARWFSRQPKQKRGILFLAFAGEENGLLGSAFYAEHPELPIDNAVAMLNMDMIGRIREGKVYIGGVGTGSTFRDIVSKISPQHSSLKVDFTDGPDSGASDHTSFTAKRVPALFFFSGLHSDYHKPSDTWDKIDSAGAANLLGLVGEIADSLRTSDVRPEFKRVAPANPHSTGTAGPVTSSSGSGYGPWFGSVPDFAEGIKGVKFADVTPGSPAAAAGFKGGDIMVEFDGKPIENLYDFTYALRGKKPGDTVKVKILRDNNPIEKDVLLTRR